MHADIGLINNNVDYCYSSGDVRMHKLQLQLQNCYIEKASFARQPSIDRKIAIGNLNPDLIGLLLLRSGSLFVMTNLCFSTCVWIGIAGGGECV